MKKKILYRLLIELFNKINDKFLCLIVILMKNFDILFHCWNLFKNSEKCLQI